MQSLREKVLFRILLLLLLGIFLYYAFVGFVLRNELSYFMGMTISPSKSGRTHYLFFRPHFLWNFDKDWFDFGVPVKVEKQAI